MISRSASVAEHASIGGIRLVLGGNVFGWTADRDQSFAILDAFFEAGGRMIDTAEVYSAWAAGNKGGESEAIIGAWQESRGVRNELLIGTKTGMGAAGLKPESVAASLAASLERLRTDYVDVYYAHRDDPQTALGEVVTAYDAALKSGAVRELGASNYSPERLAAIIAEAERQGAARFTVMQPEYNLVRRAGYEGPLQELCLAKGLAVTPFYGLASGFLTGKYRAAEDWAGSPRSHSLNAAAVAGGWDVLAAMDEIARESGATHTQIALAWLNSRAGIDAPLASATSVAQVADLVSGVSLELSPDQLDRLSRAGER
jgi:aryl-alcohol dehydrogenase-like predicted oxidoreductase